MRTSSFLVVEDASALSDVVSTDASPRDLGRVSLLEHIDLVSIDLDSAIDLLNRSLELAYNSVKRDIIVRLQLVQKLGFTT